MGVSQDQSTIPIKSYLMFAYSTSRRQLENDVCRFDWKFFFRFIEIQQHDERCVIQNSPVTQYVFRKPFDPLQGAFLKGWFFLANFEQGTNCVEQGSSFFIFELNIDF